MSSWKLTDSEDVKEFADRYELASISRLASNQRRLGRSTADVRNHHSSVGARRITLG